MIACRELSDVGLHAARTHIVGDTSPARALHRVVERERADLLVVGSTHRGSIGRVLADEVALATLEGSPCRVAVAPSRIASMDDMTLRSIGVGFDAGPGS